MQTIYKIGKAPLGWIIYRDGVKIGGIYVSKEAALEAATVAAAFDVRAGIGIQINVRAQRSRTGYREIGRVGETRNR
jgi:hypothetical protein